MSNPLSIRFVLGNDFDHARTHKSIDFPHYLNLFFKSSNVISCCRWGYRVQYVYSSQTMGQTDSKESGAGKCAQCGEHAVGVDRKCQSCGAVTPARKTTALQTLFTRKTTAPPPRSLLQKIPSKHLIDTSSFSKDKNYAVVFLKPTVPKTDLIRARLESHFAAFKVQLTSEGTLTAKEINEKGIIDMHYSALAKNAMDMSPTAKRPAQLTEELHEKFKQEFGVEYSNPETVLTLGQFLQRTPQLSAQQLDLAWQHAKKLKIAGGFYVGRLEELEGDSTVCPEVRPLLVVNGFYASMRRDYVEKPNTVLFFTAEWKEQDLSWKDFRAECIGSTNPATASASSLRGKMLQHWEDLGLPQKPDVTRNCVHASAGPIEALRERATWIQISLDQDPFAKLLLAQGVPRAYIEHCTNNEEVTVEGKTGPAFDVFEDVNSSTVVDQLLKAAAEAKL